MRSAAALAGAFLFAAAAPGPAWADNAMGYRLLTPQEASGLRSQGGTLGLDLQGTEMISEPGMSFEIMRVSGVHRGAPGAQAGFRTGDEIVSVNGRVFPSLAVFAAFVHALPPGQPASVDYIPAGGGPAQAQRVQVVPGGASGMSTREKVAIGVGAAALFGCYELGCFRHRQPRRRSRCKARHIESRHGRARGQAGSVSQTCRSSLASSSAAVRGRPSR